MLSVAFKVRGSIALGSTVLGSVLLVSTLHTAFAADASTRASSTTSGSGPQQTVLIDNNKLHVTHYTFKTGDERRQPITLKADELVVFLDDGAVEPLGGPGGTADSTAAKAAGAQGKDCAKASVDCGAVAPDGGAVKPGTIVHGAVDWNPKGTVLSPMRVTKGYRAVVIELKHGTMTGADPAAAKMPREPVVGGGAPMKVVLDNDMVRANLVSFKSGFIRPGEFRRRLDTLIVYVDDAKLEDVGPSQSQFEVVKHFTNHPEGKAECPPIKDCDSVAPNGEWSSGDTVRGTVAWHQQDGYVERIQIGKDYRAFYIEFK